MLTVVRLLRWGLGLCALLLVLLALLVSLARELVPLLADYREVVQQQVTESLGVPVKIGSLTGSWRALTPQLSAHDVWVGSGESATRLDQLDIRPDVLASLWSRQLRLASVQLTGLHVIVREDQHGRWQLQGLPKMEGQASGNWPQLWQRLQSLSELSVFGGLLTVQGYEQEPLSFSYIEFTLRNGLLGQSGDLRLRLPDGQAVALNAQVHLDPKRWQDSQAKIYVQLPRSDWASWLPLHAGAPWRLEQLQFAAQAWLNWRDGGLAQARLLLSEGQIRGAYGPAESLQIEHLSLSAALEQHNGGASVQVDDLQLDHANGQVRAGQLSAKQQLDQQGETLAWQLSLEQLDLAPLQSIIQSYAPIAQSMRELFGELNLQGRLSNLSLRYQPQLEGPERVSFSTQLEQLSSNAWRGVPTLHNVTGSLSGDLAGGELRLNTQNFALGFPRVFEHMWHYHQAEARLLWRLDEQAFSLHSPYLRLQGDEGLVSGDFMIRLFKDPQLEDYMDLRVGLSQGNAQEAKKYLPKPSASFTPALAQWLDQAIVQADIEQGWFQYQGALSPVAGPGSRNISLYFLVDNAQLAFQSGWPSLDKVRGEVLVDAAGVRVNVPTAQLSNSYLTALTAEVPKAKNAQPAQLQVQAQISSDLQDTLQILQNAPIGAAQIFTGWQGEGPLTGALQLQIPLAAKAKPKVVADFSTDGVNLSMSSPKLAFSELKADFRYDSDSGLSSPAISALAFGYPLHAQAFAEGSFGHTRTRIEAKSQIDVEQLSHWLGVTAKLPGNGGFAYQLSLLLEGADSQLRVSSDLKGLSVELPEPFAKSADQLRPSVWRMTLQGQERRYWLDYGDQVKLSMAAPFGHLLEGRGELRLGTQPVTLPTQPGLRVRGQLANLDWSEWQRALKPYLGQRSGSSSWAWFNGAELEIAHFAGFGTEVDQLQVNLQRAEGRWDLALSSTLLHGVVRLPDASAQPIAIELSQLSFPEPEQTAATDEKVDKPDPLAALDPRSIPDLDVRIDKVLRGADVLGRWAFKARQQEQGVLFSDLALQLKGLELDGQLSWLGKPGATQSFYKGRLQGENLATVLKNWGFAPSVSSSRFRLDADAQWPGSPAGFALKRFSGNFDVSLRDGQFVEVDGAASALRVFGLLNFNAIGRRLRLDFSDLLGQGFSYDTAKARLKAQEGIYETTKALRIVGPSSSIEIDGQFNARTEEVDAKLLVTLPISHNLPLAAAAIGAPLIGGALFVADKLLGNSVARLTSAQYQVKGQWSEPEITFDKPFEKPQ